MSSSMDCRQYSMVEQIESHLSSTLLIDTRVAEWGTHIGGAHGEPMGCHPKGTGNDTSPYHMNP